MSTPTRDAPNSTGAGSNLRRGELGWWTPAGKLALVLSILVAILVIAGYWPVLSTRAQYFDDDEYLNNNPLVRRPGLDSALRFFSEVTRPSTVRGYYQPLTMVSLMADYALGGRVDDPRMFRRTSLALHGLNAALVTLLLYRLFRAPWPAALLGLLFGLHPTTVESVAWLAERKNVLSMFFALLALLAYVEFARRGRNRLYAACVITFVLALLAKPVAVGLPVVMLLLDYWPLRRLNWSRVRDKFQLLGIGALFAFFAYLSQTNTVSTQFFEHKAPIDRPLAILHNSIFYLQKAFWPADVCPFYPIPSPMDWSQPPIRAGIIGTPILLTLLLLSWRWTRAAVTGWAIFFITLLPTMGLVRFTPVIAADRFLYLPMLGLLLPLAAALGWLWTRPRNRSYRWAGRTAIIVLAAGAATVCAAATRRQLGNWQDTLTINRAILEHAPQSTHAHHNLAVELSRRGELAKAIEQYRMALSLDPESGSSQYGLAVALFQQRHLAEALHEFQRAFGLSPHRPEVRCGLASALAELGRQDEACTVLDECLQLFPNCAVAHTNLGLLLAQGAASDKREQALLHLTRAVELEPGNVAFRYNLADFMGSQGQSAAAIEHYQRVLQLDPSHEPARAGLLRAQQALKR